MPFYCLCFSDCLLQLKQRAWCGSTVLVSTGLEDAINSLNQKEINWPWWAWLSYGVVMAFCFAPMFYYVWSRRREFQMNEKKFVGVSPKKLPGQESLNKIYGPKWAMIEVGRCTPSHPLWNCCYIISKPLFFHWLVNTKGWLQWWRCAASSK